MAKTIAIEKVFELIAKKREINSLKLEDIVWTKDGKEFKFSPKDIYYWELTGLTNIDFITTHFAEKHNGQS